MPRQDVPYGGAICRLKERIAEIWDKLGEKLHSINGVEGDGAGDVKIVSGDAAVVITSDQVNHQIEVALDSSRLPAASVSSVNGQTGAVALTADDISSDNGNVQTDLDTLAAVDGTLQGNINAETLARQGADAALQGNINTLSASIPTAAATAVANDPTVAQLATDVPNKVDKITSGSSLKAYTHTGATQGETSVVDGTTANSIGIRDANGRMQAADPASGATDKTLVTANWVSQTGDSAPNNLLHRAGNETSTGFKFGNFSVKQGNVPIPQPSTDGKYRRIFRIKNVSINTAIDMRIYVNSNINFGGMLDVFALIGSAVWGNKIGLTFGGYVFNGVFFGFDGTNIDIWLIDQQYRSKSIKINNILTYGSTIQPAIDFDGTTTIADYTTFTTYTVTGSII